MPRERLRPEEIIAKLREADVLLGQGKRVAEVVEALGVNEVTYYRWHQVRPREHRPGPIGRAVRLPVRAAVGGPGVGREPVDVQREK